MSDGPEAAGMAGHDGKGEKSWVRKLPEFTLDFLFYLFIPECLGFIQL